MKKLVSLLFICTACASPDRPSTPEASRNVISAGVGVASVMTDCGDGMQRDTRGTGIGFILTACPHLTPEPKNTYDESRGTGIVSLGFGLAITVSDCGGFRLQGVGLGMGVVAAPCPRAPQPKG